MIKRAERREKEKEKKRKEKVKEDRRARRRKKAEEEQKSRKADKSKTFTKKLGGDVTDIMDRERKKDSEIQKQARTPALGNLTDIMDRERKKELVLPKTATSIPSTGKKKLKLNSMKPDSAPHRKAPIQKAASSPRTHASSSKKTLVTSPSRAKLFDRKSSRPSRVPRSITSSRLPDSPRGRKSRFVTPVPRKQNGRPRSQALGHVRANLGKSAMAAPPRKPLPNVRRQITAT